MDSYDLATKIVGENILVFKANQQLLDAWNNIDNDAMHELIGRLINNTFEILEKSITISRKN